MIDPSERLAFIYRSNVSMTEAIDRIYNGLVNQRSPHNSLADFTITRKIADIKREDVEKEGLFARKKIGTRIYLWINFEKNLINRWKSLFSLLNVTNSLQNFYFWLYK